MGILFNKEKSQELYREINSNDFILKFDEDIKFNINEYPSLKKSGKWSPYAGNCYRGFSVLNEEELYDLFCKELNISESKMKVLYTSPLGAPSAKE